jgi:hypothetical protein
MRGGGPDFSKMRVNRSRSLFRKCAYGSSWGGAIAGPSLPKLRVRTCTVMPKGEDLLPPRLEAASENMRCFI